MYVHQLIDKNWSIIMFKKLLALSALTLVLPAHAAVVESGDLNIINQLGNASDGLAYLDTSFSVGLTASAALTNAQATYADARLATASEFDDLFAAAGISYDGAQTASAGFATGPNNDIISSGANYDGGTLAAQLGFTVPGFFTALFTDPDGEGTEATTRDFTILFNDRAQLNSTPLLPGSGGQSAQLAFLIVSDTAAAVPVPAGVWLFGSALAGMIGVRAKRAKK